MNTEGKIQKFIRPSLPIPDEFFSNKTVDENNCWIWQGKLNSSGYGIIRMLGSAIPVYRLSLVLETGDDPRGLVACHKPNVCLSKACYNPDHLYWGTASQNSADKLGSIYKTECKRGHKIVDERRKIGCQACEKIKYIAKKLHAGDPLSRTNLKVLENLGVTVESINIQDYI